MSSTVGQQECVGKLGFLCNEEVFVGITRQILASKNIIRRKSNKTKKFYKTRIKTQESKEKISTE